MFPRAAFAVRLYGSSVSIPFGWFFVTLVTAGASVVALAPPDISPIRLPLWYLSAIPLIVAAFGSLLLHELGHAAAARRVGLGPERMRLYPFGGAREGFGDPGTPFQNTVVALAGPATSLALGTGLALIWWLLPDGASILGRDFGYLAIVNLILGGVNLLPGYPLDGGRVFRALVWYLHDDFSFGTRAAVIYGQVISVLTFAMGLVLLGVGRSQAIWGLWLVLLSWAMNRAARDELTRTFFVVVGAHLSAGEIVAGMNPRLEPDQTLDAVLDVLLSEAHGGPGLVYEGDSAVGVLPLDQLRRYRRADWADTRAADAMIPLDGLPQIPDTASVRDLLGWLTDSEADLLLITKADTVIGVVDRRLALTQLVARAKSRDRLVHP